jgi:hypothetical protein
VTTNVPKGANRASAAKRTRKHAQRTPLPPRPGVVDDAREVIALAPNLDPALVEKASQALVDWVSHGEYVKAADESASSNGELPTVATWGKAAAFAKRAGELEWRAVTEARGSTVEVTATRGDETIVQAWHGGVWQYDASIYAFGDRTTKPRNASGAAKLLDRSVEDARAETSKVAANKHFRKAEPKDLATTMETARRSLPFDPELATDEEVLTVLSGQSVVWYNRIGRSQESAIVGRTKSLRMTQNEKGERVVNWCCPVTGFRSCLVTAILKVGRGRLESSKAETMKVLVEA